MRGFARDLAIPGHRMDMRWFGHAGRSKLENMRLLRQLPFGFLLLAVATAGLSETKTFGTATSYVSVGAGDLQPSYPAQTFTRGIQITADSGDFWAYPHLPSGALVTSYDLDYCDPDGGLSPYQVWILLDRSGNELTIVVLDRQSLSPGCHTITIDMTSSHVVINPIENRFTILTTLQAPASINGLVVAYQLQVSAAPASATFLDVPTSDFGFQYVEALVAAGVTGGCGGGNYCPDTPVTRRQMAIFIAKALGLHWP